MRILFLALGIALSLLLPVSTFALSMRTSWYQRGTITASGTRFDPDDPTIAAHKTLPFGTVLKVTNPKNGKTLRVVVKDRGPFIKGRSLDLTRAAAKILGFFTEGVAILEVHILKK